MAGNGGNEMSVCERACFTHSASSRTRRSNNRYSHISSPLAPHHDDSDRELPSFACSQTGFLVADLTPAEVVEKIHRQFLRADSMSLPSSGRAGLREGIGEN